MAMPQNGARLKIKYARWACISNPFDILAYFMPPDFLSFSFLCGQNIVSQKLASQAAYL